MGEQRDKTGDAMRADLAADRCSAIVAADPPDDAALRTQAEQLATFANLDFADADDASVELRMVVTPERVELRWTEPDLKKRQPVLPISVDLLKLDITSGHGRSKKTPIAKAVGVSKGDDAQQPTVLDATAGLGEDSWLLASLGCRVVAVERNPVMAALLADGLRRAASDWPAVASRITLLHCSSIEALKSLASGNTPAWQQLHPAGDVGTAQSADVAGVDVVYIDPMFPHGRGSALEARPMRLLRRLVGPDGDADLLLSPAMAVAQRRVVVKRPRHAEVLAGQPADVTHGGKAVRFDVYLPAVRSMFTCE